MHVATVLAARLGMGDLPLSDGLVDLALEFLLLLLGEFAGSIPVMLVEGGVVTATAAAGLVTGLAAFTAVAAFLLLALEDVIHLLRVEPTEAWVKAADGLAVPLGHRQHILVRVHIDKHLVDDIVTRDVGEVWVLVVKLLPDGQMAERLVQVLMQDNESQFLVVERLDELATVYLVAPVGAGSHDSIRHAGLADHDYAGP